MNRSCPVCRYSGTPGVHTIDPAEGRTDFTADELANLEPYTVPCPVRAAADAEAEAAELAVKHQHDESTAAFQAAKDIVADAARRLPRFSANDVRTELDAAQIPGAVVGAAFSWAQRQGLIEADGTEPSTDGPTHSHRIFRWRSLRYRQGRVS